MGDRVKLTYFYDTSLSGLREFVAYYPVVMDLSNYTMMQNRVSTYGLGIMERSLITVCIVLLIVGIATLAGQAMGGLAFGLFIMGFLAYIEFIPLWSVLISITLGVIYLGSRPGG